MRRRLCSDGAEAPSSGEHARMAGLPFCLEPLPFQVLLQILGIKRHPRLTRSLSLGRERYSKELNR